MCKLFIKKKKESKRISCSSAGILVRFFKIIFGLRFQKESPAHSIDLEIYNITAENLGLSTVCQVCIMNITC